MSPGVASKWPGLGPVATLLTAACCVDREAAERGIEEALAGEIDEDELFLLATRNRVAPLVHTALRAHGASERFPSLGEAARHVQWLNIFIIEELLHLVERCDELGVDIMVYKGPILGLQLHEDHGERMYKDLDVIVRPKDVSTALGLFRERGFEPLSAYGPLDKPALESLIKDDCEIRLRRSSPDLLVELHWHVLPPQHRGRIEMDGLWERRESIALAGCRIGTLAPEDTLLQVAIHGADKHRWIRLQMVTDVARYLTRGPALDWETVLNRAHRMGRVSALLEALGLSWLLLGADLPQAAVPMLRRSSALALAGVVMGRQFRPDRGIPRFVEWRSYVDALADRTAARGDVIDESPGWMHYLEHALSITWADQPVRLPPAMSFAYYLYRPFRLLAKHRAGLLKRI